MRAQPQDYHDVCEAHPCQLTSFCVSIFSFLKQSEFLMISSLPNAITETVGMHKNVNTGRHVRSFSCGVGGGVHFKLERTLGYHTCTFTR